MTVQRYKAGAEFEKLLNGLLPLRVERILGEVPKDKLAEFGLVEPRGRLRIDFGGQSLEYKIGKETYGRATAYMLSPDGQLSLISTGTLNSLDFKAPRYMERRLLGASAEEVDRVEVRCGELGARRLNRLGETGEKRWVPEDDEDSTEVLYTTWIDRLFKLDVTEYLQAGREVGEGSVCTLRLMSGASPVDELRLVWRQAEQGKVEAFGQSRFVGGWVALGHFNAGNFVSDLPSVLAGPGH